MAHQWVHVNRLKGPRQQVFLEIRPHHPEERLHVQHLIVKAMLSFVELHREQLYVWRENKKIIRSGNLLYI